MLVSQLHRNRKALRLSEIILKRSETIVQLILSQARAQARSEAAIFTAELIAGAQRKRAAQRPLRARARI